MSTKVSKQSNIFESLLPTRDEAIQNSLSSYFQKTIQKITILLAKISSRHPNKISKSESKRYQDLSNEEITQRSYFIFYIYETIISLYEFFKLIKIKQVRQSQISIKKTPFKQFIQSLFMSQDELAKLSRIKKEIDLLVIDYKRRILFLLYEAQVYIFQILLRIIVLKIIYDENEQYQRQKQQIRRNYFYIDYQVNQKNKITFNLGKFNRMKHIFKDINCISRFYHCQISISRPECNSKPQMYSLVYLLKVKLNSSLFALILENCEFKCKQQLISSFTHPFRNIRSDQRVQTLEQINEISIYPINETSISKIQCYDSQLIVKRQEQQIIKNQSKYFQLSLQSEEKPCNSQEELQKSNQIQEQSKKQQDANINQMLNRYQNINKINKEPTEKFNQQKQLDQPKKGIDISLLDLKYKRQQYLGQRPSLIKIKPKKTHHSNINLHKKSLHEKMQQIPNRFTHAQCNFKYVMNSKTIKRSQQIKKFQQQSKKEGQILPRQPKIYFTALKDDSDESFLAEQTPVHKNRTYMKPNNQKS